MNEIQQKNEIEFISLIHNQICYGIIFFIFYLFLL